MAAHRRSNDDSSAEQGWSQTRNGTDGRQAVQGSRVSGHCRRGVCDWPAVLARQHPTPWGRQPFTPPTPDGEGSLTRSGREAGHCSQPAASQRPADSECAPSTPLHSNVDSNPPAREAGATWRLDSVRRPCQVSGQQMETAGAGRLHPPALLDVRSCAGV
ncbi:hypothetical protein P154DRAFT_575047 [Amniculicola lignicola CBS 123094]|uniref:Uncharacterized protein n=1 Tax=Amniculicola lignicola CBS 123094 TaxID=1392246 RepID=A0A6A5WI20_9PLEO|nr:hypothetical protein P154DRAFT_575047 [Amniculicola lignicola CBS 123094]